MEAVALWISVAVVRGMNDGRPKLSDIFVRFFNRIVDCTTLKYSTQRDLFVLISNGNRRIGSVSTSRRSKVSSTDLPPFIHRFVAKKRKRRNGCPRESETKWRAKQREERRGETKRGRSRQLYRPTSLIQRPSYGASR